MPPADRSLAMSVSVPPPPFFDTLFWIPVLQNKHPSNRDGSTNPLVNQVPHYMHPLHLHLEVVGSHKEIGVSVGRPSSGPETGSSRIPLQGSLGIYRAHTFFHLS